MRKGHFAFILCAVASILFPPLAAQDPPAAGAIIEYKTIFAGMNRKIFLEIDGQRYDAMRPGNGLGRVVRREYPVAPSKHSVGFVIEGSNRLYPQSIEFTAEAGKRYRADFDELSHKETIGDVTTLYYHHFVPAVLVQQGKKFMPLVSGAKALFKPQRDRAGHLLLYEDATLPMERTARIYCPRKGLIKTASVYFASISGDAGSTRVEYRRQIVSDPWQLRLLPGNYKFVVTLEGGAWKVAYVVSGEKEISLQVEAGRTYRLLVKGESQGTQFNKDAIGNTQMTTSFTWEPYFEDVTGKGYTDQ